MISSEQKEISLQQVKNFKDQVGNAYKISQTKVYLRDLVKKCNIVQYITIKSDQIEKQFFRNLGIDFYYLGNCMQCNKTDCYIQKITEEKILDLGIVPWKNLHENEITIFPREKKSRPPVNQGDDDVVVLDTPPIEKRQKVPIRSKEDKIIIDYFHPGYLESEDLIRISILYPKVEDTMISDSTQMKDYQWWNENLVCFIWLWMTFDKKKEDIISAIPNPLSLQCKFQIDQEGYELNDNDKILLFHLLHEPVAEKKKYILFPFNHKKHWFLIVIVNFHSVFGKNNHRNCAMLVIDSLIDSPDFQNTDEVVYKYRDFLCNHLKISSDRIRRIHLPVKYKQTDGYSCGVFVAYMMALFENKYGDFEYNLGDGSKKYIDAIIRQFTDHPSWDYEVHDLALNIRLELYVLITRIIYIHNKSEHHVKVRESLGKYLNFCTNLLEVEKHRWSERNGVVYKYNQVLKTFNVPKYKNCHLRKKK